MASIDILSSQETGKAFLNNGQPQTGRSSVVKASLSALNTSEQMKMNRILVEEYNKKQKTILDQPLGDVLNNTVNFFGRSFELYEEKVLDAKVTRKLYETDDPYLNNLQIHMMAIGMFVRDEDNIIYLGIIMIILSILICFFNISRGNGFSEPVKES